ncbi:MAG: TPM domain-containing protein [Paludibacteraceae bacterium]|nr:TPM domain-containing protein [Paludibacteraceae bacterium]
MAYYTPQTLPNPRVRDANAYVCNPDGVFSNAQVEQLNNLSAALYEQSDVELVIVAVDDIGMADVFDFSVELFNKWGIGAKGKNTGVLMLLVLQSRDIRISTGGGLEGLLTDEKCTQIIYDIMIPLLKQGYYADGMLAGGKAIADVLTTDAAKAELLLGYKAKEVTTAPWSGFAGMSIFVIILVLLAYYLQPKCPYCKKHGARRSNEVIREATLLAAGAGIAHYTCKHCQSTWHKSYTIARLIDTSTGGYGGRGGFGGGSFGGGSFGGGMTFGGGAGGKF